jgi:hypothetical protein
MISSPGSFNIPVEDTSYKWSKKILKTFPARVFLATIIADINK